ncbi:unnamed protein product [Closterium sp. Yama58-4]|nr:unnamed protein product [Closterium sp. Yama58-4]
MPPILIVPLDLRFMFRRFQKTFHLFSHLLPQLFSQPVPRLLHAPDDVSSFQSTGQPSRSTDRPCNTVAGNPTEGNLTDEYGESLAAGYSDDGYHFRSIPSRETLELSFQNGDECGSLFEFDAGNHEFGLEWSHDVADHDVADVADVADRDVAGHHDTGHDMANPKEPSCDGQGPVVVEQGAVSNQELADGGMAGEGMGREGIGGQGMGGEGMGGEAIGSRGKGQVVVDQGVGSNQELADGGMAGEGLRGEEVRGQGMGGEGIVGEGTVGEGIVGEGIVGEGIVGEAIVGEAIVREAIAGEAVAGEAVAGEAVAGEAVAGEGQVMIEQGAGSNQELADGEIGGEGTGGERMEDEGIGGEDTRVREDIWEEIALWNGIRGATAGMEQQASMASLDDSDWLWYLPEFPRAGSMTTQRASVEDPGKFSDEILQKGSVNRSGRRDSEQEKRQEEKRDEGERELAEELMGELMGQGDDMLVDVGGYVAVSACASARGMEMGAEGNGEMMGMGQGQLTGRGDEMLVDVGGGVAMNACASLRGMEMGAEGNGTTASHDGMVDGRGMVDSRGMDAGGAIGTRDSMHGMVMTDGHGMGAEGNGTTASHDGMNAGGAIGTRDSMHGMVLTDGHGMGAEGNGTTASHDGMNAGGAIGTRDSMHGMVMTDGHGMGADDDAEDMHGQGMHGMGADAMVASSDMHGMVMNGQGMGADGAMLSQYGMDGSGITAAGATAEACVRQMLHAFDPIHGALASAGNSPAPSDLPAPPTSFLPGLSDLSGPPGLPGLPSLPGLPGLPALPSLPDLPDLAVFAAIHWFGSRLNSLLSKKLNARSPSFHVTAAAAPASNQHGQAFLSAQKLLLPSMPLQPPPLLLPRPALPVTPVPVAATLMSALPGSTLPTCPVSPPVLSPPLLSPSLPSPLLPPHHKSPSHGNGGKRERRRKEGRERRAVSAREQLGLSGARGALPQAAAQKMLQWLVAHWDNPKPSKEDKMELMTAFNITKKQVEDWFVNARARLWKPLTAKLCAEIVREQRIFDVVVKEAADTYVSKPAEKEAPVLMTPELLAEAYERCGEVCAEYAKTFYLGTKLMTPERRRAIWAIYVWCRRTDELVDGPNASHITPRALDRWEERLDELFQGRPYDMLDAALSDTIQTFPMSIQPYRDMVDGMRMDLRKSRYRTFDELYVYCYNVAGTVGLMSVPVMGIDPKSKVPVEDVYKAALDLGIANQLTNILRDVGEDAQRGRVYLPQDELAQFGLSDDDIFEGKVTDNWRSFMKFQIERARNYFKTAEAGVVELDRQSRWPVWASLRLYAQILDAIEANDYDNFTRRAYVSKWKKMMSLPGTYIVAAKGPQ